VLYTDKGVVELAAIPTSLVLLKNDAREDSPRNNALPLTIPTTDTLNAAPSYYGRGMTFANVGTLGTLPGKRDELVRHLIRRNDILPQIGCLAYEVGVNDDDPDTVFVVELWESEDAHQASLALPEVQASITVARPLLSGKFGGFRFDVAGSPLRD
jgi:quinol monooxygenase YgiN